MGTMRLTDSYNERFGFRARGCFYCRYKYEPPLAAAVVVVTLTLWGVAYRFVVAPQASVLLYAAALLMDCAVFFCAGVGALRVVLGGKKFLYEADDNEFRVYAERGRDKILTDTFYYVDIEGVSYQKMIPHRGEVVTVATKYRKYKYQCVYRCAKNMRAPERLPFHILEEMKGARSAEVAEGGERL